MYFLFFVLICDYVGRLEFILTVKIFARTNGLNKASSYRVYFFLLRFHSVSKSLNFGKCHDHGYKILVDSVLLICICCKFESEGCYFFSELINDFFESVSFLGVQFEPKFELFSVMFLATADSYFLCGGTVRLKEFDFSS